MDGAVEDWKSIEDNSASSNASTIVYFIDTYMYICHAKFQAYISIFWQTYNLKTVPVDDVIFSNYDFEHF